MHWNKLYDGTKESLIPRSHKPQTLHPNTHTEQELKWIRDYHRCNPKFPYANYTVNQEQNRLF